jgi:allantoate deiminase
MRVYFIFSFICICIIHSCDTFWQVICISFVSICLNPQKQDPFCVSPRFPIMYAFFTIICVLTLTAVHTTHAKAVQFNVSEVGLPAAVLHHILVVEPNLFLDRLGNVSAVSGSLKRTFLDSGHTRAARLINDWMGASGMRTWRDAVGNVRGRASGDVPGSAAMFVGSHYDTVDDGGKFDGALGLATGIAAVKALFLENAVRKGVISATEIEEAVATAASRGELFNVRRFLRGLTEPLHLRRPVEVVAFSDEEGVRFQTTFLGSKGLAGTLVSSGALDKRDNQGWTLSEALSEAGLASSVQEVQEAALPQGVAAGYVEVHLEQGPVLEREGRPLGVVSGIAGQTFLLASFHGDQGHAGTVPMRMRRDPLAAAAEVINSIERLCVKGGWGADSRTQHGSVFKRVLGMLTSSSKAQDSTLVCTVGKVGLWPGAPNVIPGHANLTMDIRSQWDASRKATVEAAKLAVKEACSHRGLSCDVEVRHEAPAMHCDESLTEGLITAADGAQEIAAQLIATASSLSGEPMESQDESEDTQTSTLAEIKPLVSGAGHDAMAMADAMPVGMIFVRCKDGLSHSPAEYVSPQDVATATVALWRFLKAWEGDTEALAAQGALHPSGAAGVHAHGSEL